MSTALVTGASGFVGKCLINELISEKKFSKIIAIVHNSPLDLIETDPCVSEVRINLLERWQISDEVDVIYNFAADGSQMPYSKESSLLFERIADNAIDFAISRKAKLFHSSSGGAVSQNTNIDDKLYFFTRSRKNVENKIMNAGVDNKLAFQIGRLYSFIGPTLFNKNQYMINQHIKSALRSKKVVLTGQPNSKKSYMYETDMAMWISKISEIDKPEVWNISGYEKPTILDVAKFICDYLDAELFLDTKEDLEFLYAPNNMEKEAQLGLIQKISWQEGLKLTIEWAREKGSNSYE
jgi:nucleoside-diphosphate-sugar epimerase